MDVLGGGAEVASVGLDVEALEASGMIGLVSTGATLTGGGGIVPTTGEDIMGGTMGITGAGVSS